jgi:hypothetical protein
MKTSNKILLVTFFTVLLIMVGVHVALYAKYKKGDFTAVNDEMWPMNMISQSLTGINYVLVDNVENLTIEAGDSSKFQYDKPGEGDENILSVTRKADTLFVVGKSTKNNIGRWYRRANLSISGLLPVHVKNSQLHLNRSKNTQPLAMDISLDETSMEVNNDSQESLNFSILKVNAVNGSEINLFNTTINDLDVTLRNSSLEETKLNSDSIRITTDASSKIQLSGKNLQKAKIILHE